MGSQPKTWQLSVSWQHPLNQAHHLEDRAFINKVAERVCDVLNEQARMDELERVLGNREEYPEALGLIMAAYHKHRH